MLSRENVIHRSAGEERRARMRVDRAAAGRAAAAGAGGDALLKGQASGRAVLLILIVGLLAAFVFLNRGAFVEPRADLVFWSFERPSLLLITLLTSVPTAAGVLLARAALDTRRRLQDLRAAALLAPPHHAAAPMKEPAAAATAS